MYETTDLLLATTLCTYGFTIKELKYIGNKRCTFCFDKSELLLKTIDDFFKGLCRVEPIEQGAQQKRIKSRIYHMKRNKNHE